MKRTPEDDDEKALGRAARKARTEPDGRLAAAVELAIDTDDDLDPTETEVGAGVNDDDVDADADKDAEATKKPLYVKYGINHITKLCEEKKAQLVVIAHDVDPIELVIWLPAVCRKLDIPYCIVKSKSRLGALVHKKTATALALTSVRSEDRHEFSQLVTAIRQQYNENAKQIERTWGGGIMGCKSQAATAKLERAIAKEAAKKAMM